MRPTALDSATEVEQVVRNLLRASKALDRFPTPVDTIIDYADLAVAKNIDLDKVEAGFFPRLEFLSSALKKVLGLVDFRQRTIYLDQTLPATRQAFIKLHEVGHGVMPWQRQLREGFADDEFTLDPDLNEHFECEANHFASAALFQLDRFDDDLRSLPLAFKAIQALAQKYGSSIQAAARRYVARCPRRCALLVLQKPILQTETGSFSVPLRNCFESPGFVADFGLMAIPDTCDLHFPFVRDIRRNRRFHEDGTITLVTLHNPSLLLNYHFFNNSYNSFVFLFPPGESISSRISIMERPPRSR